MSPYTIKTLIKDIKVFVEEEKIKSDFTDNEYVNTKKLNEYLNKRLKEEK